MLAIAKFGGSSLSCAAAWRQVRDIVTDDIARRVIVVSAAGKRHADDHKITDLLYLCHAHLRYGVPCWELWRKIAGRYLAIRDECAINFPIEDELDAIYENLSPRTSADFLASRGEYLSAKLMAAYLGFSFVDAASWLQFDYAGNVLTDSSYAALSSLADGRKIVTPGFYGALPDGRIHTFSRGGSDITGSLAAAALHADVYENWTDVAGILTADPKIVDAPRTIAQLSYAELQALSQVGMQVLHESAVEPVRRRQIPLQIRDTSRPELAGTLIRCGCGECPAADGVVGFAGRRGLAMLRLEQSAPLRYGEREILERAGLPVFSASEALGRRTLLVGVPSGGADTLHAAAEEIERTLHPARLKLRENLAALAVLYRGADAPSAVVDAVQGAGVPVHQMSGTAPCLLLTVNDSQYETALRAAYQAR